MASRSRPVDPEGEPEGRVGRRQSRGVLGGGLTAAEGCTRACGGTSAPFAAAGVGGLSAAKLSRQSIRALLWRRDQISKTFTNREDNHGGEDIDGKTTHPSTSQSILRGALVLRSVSLKLSQVTPQCSVSTLGCLSAATWQSRDAAWLGHARVRSSDDVKEAGAPGRTRTNNLRFTKPLLCQLSYRGARRDNSYADD
jgi:hypothetical protein